MYKVLLNIFFLILLLFIAFLFLRVFQYQYHDFSIAGPNVSSTSHAFTYKLKKKLIHNFRGSALYIYIYTSVKMGKL